MLAYNDMQKFDERSGIRYGFHEPPWATSFGLPRWHLANWLNHRCGSITWYFMSAMMIVDWKLHFHEFYFSNVIIPADELIFFRGVGIPGQPPTNILLWPWKLKGWWHSQKYQPWLVVYLPRKISWLTNYPLVMTNVAMDNHHAIFIGQPSISMGHLYHGYVSHNQMVLEKCIGKMLKGFWDWWIGRG